MELHCETNIKYIFICLLLLLGIGFFVISSKKEIIPTEATYKDILIVDFPTEDTVISSPLTVSGSARGTWYFEGDFPIILTNWDGLIIAEGYASAEGVWMTEEFVPFSGTLEFLTPEYGDRGSLILQKDNPSGLIEHDDAFEIPILFH